MEDRENFKVPAWLDNILVPLADIYARSEAEHDEEWRKAWERNNEWRMFND